MQASHKNTGKTPDIECQLDGPENAPLLVLSNPLGTTFNLWQPQLADFTHHFRVLRYNPRGHGATPLPASTLTLQQLGEDVLTLMDHLSIAHACFCGLSLGGLTGLWLNRYHPERFSRLVIANSSARIGSPDQWRQRAQQVREQGLDAVAAAAPMRWFTHAWQLHHPVLITELVASLRAADPQGYAACCEVLSSADLRPELANMPRPMLLINGAMDAITPPADSELIAHLAPDTRQVTLAAAHISSISNPVLFNRAVLDFLTHSGGTHGQHH